MGRQFEMRWGRCMIYKTGMDNGGMNHTEFRNQACERYEGCGMRNSDGPDSSEQDEEFPMGPTAEGTRLRNSEIRHARDMRGTR